MRKAPAGYLTGIQVAAENPEAYLPGDRRHALAAGREMPDRVHGAALFADISGFTPLTEALANELGAQRGAEHITASLNGVFHAVISDLDRYGGEVIYFSGDAITCWIDGDDGSRATACGLAMQETMRGMQEVVTPSGTRVSLAMKIAVAAGNARRFAVGDPDVQRIDVLAGRLIDSLAEAEHHAHKGEVILDKSALDLLAGRVEILEVRIDHTSGITFGVARRMNVDVRPSSKPLGLASLPEEVVRQWLLPVIYERLCARRGEFIAELRPACPVFVRFGGIDYDNDEEAIAKLDTFIRGVQHIVMPFGGNLLHLSLGDKGAYLCVVFGAPVAHEDDAARAAAASLKLRELSATTAVVNIQIGLTYGRLRSGMYGHQMRQAFTCLGDAVNTSARLMSHAPPGEIYVSERARAAAGDAFAWKSLAPIVVKGRADPLPIFALIGAKRSASRSHAVHELPLVGRRDELDSLAARFDDSLKGRGQVVGISAEAGVGKSRLLGEFVHMLEERRTRVVVGECQSYGTNIGYFVWRNVWMTLLDVDVASPAREQIRSLESRLAAIDPALAARSPLLSGLLDLPIPDNELTATFDAKLRKTSLENLLLECLRACSLDAPLAVVLEDCHWIDPLSRDLLGVLALASHDVRVIFVLAYRPTGSVGGGLGIESLPYFSEIALRELDPDQAATFVCSTAFRIFGTDFEPPADLVKLVINRAQGNPLYIEELINFIHGRGIDLRDDAALEQLELPDSLHSLILSRIDTVGEAPRRTLKVASVVGRVFPAAMLPGVYPELGELEDVDRQLASLLEANLLNLDVEPARTYVFKHSMTQEVVYESLPFGFRSILHERAAGYIERTQPEAIDRQLDLLAHHYWHTENVSKKREYLRRAGVAARAAYANSAAIDYFERLVPLLEDNLRVDVLLELGSVLELVGEWHRAEEVDNQALALAGRLGSTVAAAWCETALAEVARKQGRFDETVALLERAAISFNTGKELAGVGRVQHLLGTVAAQRGDYDMAVEKYASSLGIHEQLGDKVSMGALLSNLGIIAEYRGDYEEARAFHERAMELRTAIGDHRAIAVSMNNLGMIAALQKQFEEARGWFERSMSFGREVGDVWMVALCQNNLGNAARGLGDYETARKHYAEALRSYRNYDDRWALAFLLEDIGMLAALTGDATAAFEFIGCADALRETIGSPRAPLLEATIAKELAAVGSTMSQDEQHSLRAKGRSLDIAEATDRALGVCLGGAEGGGPSSFVH
ncbi:MAG TPA: tetratricopeptide repeat protein [Aliidongia sp.]|nr:tetratricopeptide repeat protein [Aliidongia sp.]